MCNSPATLAKNDNPGRQEKKHGGTIIAALNTLQKGRPPATNVGSDFFFTNSQIIFIDLNFLFRSCLVAIAHHGVRAYACTCANGRLLEKVGHPCGAVFFIY